MMNCAKIFGMIKAFAKPSLLLLLAVSISACGFHLRGNIPLPENIQSMYVRAPEGSFKEELLDRLEAAGAQLATAPAGADVILDVTQAVSDRLLAPWTSAARLILSMCVFELAIVFLTLKVRRSAQPPVWLKRVAMILMNNR